MAELTREVRRTRRAATREAVPEAILSIAAVHDVSTVETALLTNKNEGYVKALMGQLVKERRLIAIETPLNHPNQRYRAAELPQPSPSLR